MINNLLFTIYFHRKTFVLENILKKKRKSVKEDEDKAKSKIINLKAHRAKRIQKEKIILPDQFIKKYKANQHSYQKLKKRVLFFTKPTKNFYKNS